MSDSQLNINIKAGSLDTMIEIWSQTNSVSSTTGEQLRTWTKLHDAWSLKDTSSGNENVKVEAIENISTVYFTIYYLDGIDETMRVKLNDIEYDIIHINEIGRNRFIKLKCKKRV